MSIKNINRPLLLTILSAIVIIVGTYITIQYAKGSYRITDQGFASKTGLLSANSFPTGAQVLINGKLVTATDDTLYLEPDIYEIEIRKDGFSPWKKTLKVEENLVTQTNAQLFPAAPSLTPLTFTGVSNILPSPDGHKLIYYTASASSKTKNGLYILDLSDGFISTQRAPKQITEDDKTMNLAQADFIWSPDSSQVMVLSKNKEILLDIGKKTILAEAPDIRLKKKQILSEWEEEMYLKERQYFDEFPPEIIEIATTSAKNVYISPDKKRLLYTATASAVVPDSIVPPLPASNTQPEIRNLEIGHIYIYDREEDRNFHIGTETGTELANNKYLLATDLHQNKPKDLSSSPSAFRTLQATSSAQTAANFSAYHSSLSINTLQWYTDSKHIMFAKNNSVQILEYDGTNNNIIYSGPFYENFIYPWPDGSKIIILTSFSPDSPTNLYAIEVKS